MKTFEIKLGYERKRKNVCSMDIKYVHQAFKGFKIREVPFSYSKIFIHKDLNHYELFRSKRAMQDRMRKIKKLELDYVYVLQAAIYRKELGLKLFIIKIYKRGLQIK